MLYCKLTIMQVHVIFRCVTTSSSCFFLVNYNMHLWMLSERLTLQAYKINYEIQSIQHILLI